MAKPDVPGDELPPPYTPSAADQAPQQSSAQTIHPSHHASYLVTHLSTLPSRIRANQAASHTTQAARDFEIINRLVLELESFLSDLGRLDHHPPVAELVLVPASAVLSTWSLSGAAERRREGEILHLVRVQDPAAVSEKGSKIVGNGDTTTTKRKNDWQAPQFDGWGRFDEEGESRPDDASWWWWRDERMARRLAAYLQPKTEPRLERTAVQATVQQTRDDSRRWGWGRKKPAPVSPSPRFSPQSSSGYMDVQRTNDDKVTMTVRAEEVAFQKENDWGIWESLSGWGIVARVKVR